MPKVRSDRMTTAGKICTIIGLLLIFVMGYFIPPFAQISEAGIKLLCVFVGVLVIVSGTSQLLWPSLLGFCGLLLYGLYSSSDVYKNMLGTSTAFQMLMCWTLAGALRDSGAMNVVARWMLSRKMFKGHGYAMLFAIMFVFYVAGSILNAIAAILFAFEVWETIRDMVGVKKDGKFNTLVLIMVFLAANAGAGFLPWKNPAQIVTFENTTGATLNYGSYALMQIVIHVISFIIMCVIIGLSDRESIKKMGDVDITKIEGFTEESTKLNKRQVMLLMAFVIGVLYSLLIIIVPKTAGPVGKYINTIGQPMWFALVVVVCGFIRVDGEKLIKIEPTLKNNTMWGLLLISTVMMLIGQGLSADANGIKATLQAVLEPIFGNMPFFVFVFISALCMAVITNFFSNLATMLIFIAITAPFLAIYANQGINISWYYLAIQIPCNKAYLTYAACGTAPLLNDRDYLDGKVKWTWGVIPLVLYVLITTVFVVLLGSIA